MSLSSTSLNRSALIISPFATWPLDAGHRRRTLQMTRLLKQAGYHITFLLVAFEDHWYWRHDEETCDILRSQWDEVHVVYGHRGVGTPPKNGVHHHLDEWWDSDLEAMLRNVSGRRVFDVAVVHNVWLSKAFDFLPRRTVRVLETHDIFWKRPEAFRRIGQAPEFFICNQPDEVFGIRRADIVVAIQQKEGVELLNATGSEVVTVPFYDPTLEAEAPRLRRRDYLSPDKVSFGFLASANSFNITGLQALVQALERRIGETFAPVELVIGGRVGEHVKSTLAMKKLGFVPTEAEFYDKVDYAIAPVFDGTGFKIKTADALALEMPSLFSTHSAEGTVLDEAVQLTSPAAMAEAMIELSLRRPPISGNRIHITRARLALGASTAAGADRFIKSIARRAEPLVIDLSTAHPVSDSLVLQSFLSQIRIFSERRPVTLLLSAETMRVIARVLPPGVDAVTEAAFIDALGRPLRPRLTLLDVLGRSSSIAALLHGDDHVVWDQRWAGYGSDKPGGVLGMLPVFHSNLLWEPSPMALRRAIPKASLARFLEAGSLKRLVFIEGDLGDLTRDGGKSVWPGTIHVRVDDWMSLQNAIMSLGLRKPGEVLWLAPAHGVAFRAAIDACALHRIPFSGLVDEAWFRAGPLPHHLVQENDRRVADIFEEGLRRHSAKLLAAA